MSLQAQDCWDASEQILDAADVPHVFRYYVARGFVEPGDVVIDAACGYGYGTQILARSLAKNVVGIDKGFYQLDRARERNNTDKVSFHIVDLDTNQDLPKCDYLVSIETLEHLERPEEVLARMKRGTKKMFLSVPIGKTTHTNKWHKHDYLIRDDFIKLVVDDKWKLFHSATHGGGVHELFYFVQR